MDATCIAGTASRGLGLQAVVRLDQCLRQERPHRIEARCRCNDDPRTAIVYCRLSPEVLRSSPAA